MGLREGEVSTVANVLQFVTGLRNMRCVVKISSVPYS